ncbi:FAD-binding protein [Agromyces sp. MMS17-SY077]|uniref:FAD-binding protein n=2 Tax=Agromyces seonyuensis TaxID=2662446 RepID=A0A6I4NZX4_9MICO|nr:FAD-linked oxidase C-terminal domain-containing protein [Agromyces seonyuensis]MWB98025.1 FAD-binding protein [Agromyces seonyuensis]
MTGAGLDVATDARSLEAARADKSGQRATGRPMALVRAHSVADVQQCLRIAHARGLPVVPRGAGTGLAGGAMGGAGRLVLDLAGLDRILEIDAADGIAVVEAGVLNGDLNDALAPLGLWYAPDPASRAICSIGGNIATNAGGLLCAKYGVTREAVLGLSIVLADGTLLRTGRRTVKGVAGYDLTALFTGSEGTLGVIVEATVRVRPLPPGAPVTVAAAFPDVEAAASACSAVTAARLAPSILELMGADAFSRVADFLGPDALAGTPAADVAPGESFVVAQCDGRGAAEEAAGVLAAFASHGGRVELTEDAATGERLLAIRRAFHGALEARGSVLIEDVSVPRSALPAMFRAIEAISARTGIPIPTIAHAGDGNLHPNFVVEGDEPDDAVWSAADELFRAALALGGTLTGEHGVGVLKRRWLADELGPEQVEWQRRIKSLFDPSGILNPDVMFEPGMS